MMKWPFKRAPKEPAYHSVVFNLNTDILRQISMQGLKIEHTHHHAPRPRPKRLALHVKDNEGRYWEGVPATVPDVNDGLVYLQIPGNILYMQNEKGEYYSISQIEVRTDFRDW